MRITWYGHSMFKIEASNGFTIVTDPFDSSVGYDIPDLSADIVTVSHNHHDHNNTDAVDIKQRIINKAGNFNVNGIDIKGIKSFHDNSKGAKRGNNIIFKYSIDGFDVCHLGDLGHMLSTDDIKDLGNVDVLMIPVGGYYTMDANTSFKVVNAINPKIILPMHYKTDRVSMPILEPHDFIKMFKNVKTFDKNYLEIQKENVKDNLNVYLLNYE